MIPAFMSGASPVEHAAPLPAQADVVVIGAGIIGVMTAWELAKTGLRTVLLEKGRVAGEQSSRNWGWIRQQGRDLVELPIMVEANRMWQQLAAEVGEDLGLRQTGVMYLASRAKGLKSFEDFMPHARANGLDTVLLTPAQIAAMMPAAATTWAGAMWTASDMRAEPWVAVPALARAAVRGGVNIVENCAVRALDIAAGRIAGVVTERGRIAAPAVVVAGGAWSSLLLNRHGISIPQLSVRATVAATEPMAEVFAGGAVDEYLGFRRRDDGGYTLAPDSFHEFFIGPDAFRNLRPFLAQVWAEKFSTRFRPAGPRGYPDAWSTPRRWDADQTSPFEAMRVLDPGPNRAKVAELARRFSATFPSLGPTRIRAAWGGMIDSMPDLVPVVDRVEAVPGLVIATGMSGHGFGIGPAFGRIAAALVTGDSPGHDLSGFRLDRF